METCIVYFKVFEPWHRGPATVSIIVSERVAAPFLPFRLPSRTRFYSIHEGGDHEPIHERHSSSTSDPGESRRSDNFSLLRPRSVSVWTRWEGDNARESRATVRWVWEWNRVTWLLPLCKKCMLIRGGFRETVFGGRFSIRISSHAYLILYEMFLRSRKLIIFNKKRKWELSSKVQNLVWLIFFFY